jgi:hypothetical protein
MRKKTKTEQSTISSSIYLSILDLRALKVHFNLEKDVECVQLKQEEGGKN